MTTNVTYWVASHLTGIFEIVDQATDLLLKGSRGAGISIDRGVTTTVSASENPDIHVYFDGKSILIEEAAITSKIIDLVLPQEDHSYFRVEHNFEVPLSAGYGASAAGALGCAFALNDFFHLGHSELDLFHIAHQAEVQLKSGLGDILGLYQGGLEIRTKPGAPRLGKTIAFTNDQEWKLATISFGPISTAKILSDPEKRGIVSCVGHSVLKDLLQNPTFSEFIRQSQQFTESVGLMSLELREFSSSLPRDIESAQIMLGNSLFLFYKDQEVLDEIQRFNTDVIQEEICQETVIRRK